MSEHRLRADQISVGNPLPFDAYDERGTLLLRRGSIIASQSQLVRLLENGLYAEDPKAGTPGIPPPSYVPVQPPGPRVSVIDSLGQARSAAAALLETTDPHVFPLRTLELARAIRAAAALDADAAIGNIVTSKGTHYPSRHAVNCTALGSLLLARQEATEEEIDTCLCALLTMNVSMVGLQELMYAQEAPLSAEQKIAIAHHPEQGAAALRERGVTSEAWCAAVQNHHERLDGSGYPKKLAGEAIDRFARVLAVTDQYCTLVSERAFREGVNPGAALRHMLVKQSQGLDPTQCALLVRELTPYPPGAAVRLQNGEIAIVCRRTRHPEQPIVRALISADGRRFPEPRKRVTSQAAYHVDKSVPQSELKDIPPADKLWDDSFAAPSQEAPDADPGD